MRKAFLYELIDSLSKNEKRYFSVEQKSRERPPKYLKLYEDLKKMVKNQAYDEEALQKKYGAQLSEYKRSLYTALLASLRSFHSKNAYAAQIKEAIVESRILFQRGLEDQAIERLKEAQKWAELIEDPQDKLEINLEMLSYNRYIRQGDYAQQIDDLLTENSMVWQDLQDYVTYIRIYDQLLLKALQQYRLPSSQAVKALQDQYQRDLVGNPPKGAYARRRYFQAQALYFQLIGEAEKAFVSYQHLIDWWETNPGIKSERFHEFIIDYTNLFYTLMESDNMAELGDYLDRLEKERPPGFQEESLLFRKITNYRIIFYINQGVEDTEKQIYKKILAGLSQFPMPGSSQRAIFFNLTLFLFINESFDEVVKQCDRLIKERTDARKDLDLDALLVKVVATCNLDEELHDRALRSANRYFRASSKSRTH